LLQLNKDITPFAPDSDFLESIGRRRDFQDLDTEGKADFRAYAERVVRGDVFIHGNSESRSTKLQLVNVAASRCYACNKLTIWVNRSVAHPPVRHAEPPNEDLPDDIKADFNEARSVLALSPRSSAALLRLCIQKLCMALGGSGKDLNEDIGNLVNKGLDSRIQKALDIVRVIGNEAVHPGVLDLRDDRDTATRLFRLVNLIADKMISEPKLVAAMYESLPESKRDQINQRDKRK
jgi:hypothetical protein